MTRLRRLPAWLLLGCLGAAGCSGGSGGSKPESKGGASGGGKSSSSGGKGGSSGSKGGTASSGGGGAGDAQSSSQDNGGPQANDQVKIAPEDQARAGIQVGAVEVRAMPRTLTVAGQVVMDEGHTSHLGTLADGRITAVYVPAGVTVRRGQTLATLHSHTVHETVGALVQAYAAADRQRSALQFAEAARDRYAHLYAIRAASLEESQRAVQEVQAARNMLTDAEANVHMESEHLSELLQVSPESITPANVYQRELIPVRAVADGTVIARNVTVGQVVTTGFEAFTISNLATVWVTASVNERDLPMMRTGAPVEVTTQGYPEQVFAGRVAVLGGSLDPQTRTLPVRITVPNPGTKLRPGMFATAAVAESETRTAVFVPEEALQDINGLTVVFVTTDGTNFRAQAVKPGARSRGRVEITDGLRPGDHIVVRGAFMVKAEMLKGTMGEG